MPTVLLQSTGTRKSVEAGSPVQVQLIGQDLSPADLVVIGSHCVGLDYLMSQLQDRGFKTKLLAVGSSGGLEAAIRGECDLGGIHLYDPESDQYNRPFLTDDTRLITGYQRTQGLLYRKGDERFEGKDAETFIEQAIASDQCVMVNRNQGKRHSHSYRSPVRGFRASRLRRTGSQSQCGCRCHRPATSRLGHGN